MKVRVTGSKGLLGSAIVEAFAREGHDCCGVARVAFEGRLPVEIAPHLEAVDVVVHAAANTNVEQCELDPDACYRDNYLLTDSIARAAALTGARVAYVSSTGVYGSHLDEPYREYAEVRPPTHHHRAKFLGELAVLDQNPNHLVIRTGWLFGGPLDLPKNFVARRIDEARDALIKGADVASNTEQRGVPTYAVDVAERLMRLIDSGCGGVFNCVDEGMASRFEYVAAIVAAAAVPVRLVPSAAASFHRKAKVSPNETAVNWRMDNLGLPPMPHWRDSLSRYVSDSGLGNA